MTKHEKAVERNAKFIQAVLHSIENGKPFQVKYKNVNGEDRFNDFSANISIDKKGRSRICVCVTLFGYNLRIELNKFLSNPHNSHYIENAEYIFIDQTKGEPK